MDPRLSKSQTFAAFARRRRLLPTLAAIWFTIAGLPTTTTLSVTAGDAPGDPLVVSLAGPDWWIHDDPDGTGTERRLFEADPASPGWTPSAVPGNIQADLEAAHRLTPLWYGLGDARLHEVAETDWWYRKDVLVPATLAGARVTLVFDGVDHECEVFVNSRKVGAHAGMYRRFWFDITEAVQPGQLNRLAVRIARMPEDLRGPVRAADAPGGPNVGHASNAVRQRLKELKSPTNSAYDWAVAIYTLGIWKDVRLEATGPVRLDWVGVRTTLRDDRAEAGIHVRLDLDSRGAWPVRLAMAARRGATCARATVDAELGPGTNRVEAAFPLPAPELWWPAGHGQQPLYDLVVEVRHARTDALLDRRTTRFGIRDIRWEQTPGTPADFPNPLRLVINGRPVRPMGSNLLPPDSLFGRMDARGPRLIELARAAGINFLRLWGGGVILSETMYDRADELGIMLLQEFPLANCLPETDPVFLAHLESTAVNIVKQVRNHPSIVEWSGGNEMLWKNGDDHRALRVLERAVREEDGRLFRSTEPAQGSGAHGSYTYVYHTEPAASLTWLGAGAQNLYQRYDTSVEMRLSEFGTHSPANLEVWHRTIPPLSQWPLANQDDPVLVRKNVFWGAVLKENWLHPEITERLFGPLPDLELLVQAGQFLGAEGLRYAMDALRRKGPALGGGFMSWNYNEPWPNGAGSYMVDYDGRPLMNYDFVKQALEPVSLTLKYPSLLYDPAQGVSAQLFLASDAPAPVRDLRWHWLARDPRGRVLAQERGVTEVIEPQGVIPLSSITLRPPPAAALGPLFVELDLADAQGRRLAERLHVFGASARQAPLRGLLLNRQPDSDPGAAEVPSAARSPDAGLVARTTLEVEARSGQAERDRETIELVVRNAGEMTALFCAANPLIEDRTDLFRDHNHCCIPPGESRTITIQAAKSTRGGLTLAQTGWRISAWNADDRVIEPASSVLLAVGRRDAMCREFDGYGQPPHLPEAGAVEMVGRRPEPGRLPYLLGGDRRVHFRFEIPAAQIGGPASLRIHLSDRDAATDPVLEVLVNGQRHQRTLPRGLGRQREEPYGLASPMTAVIDLPGGSLGARTNGIALSVSNGSWVTLDAVDLEMQ